MGEPLKIMLGGVEYTIPKFNLGQQREVAKIFAGPKDDISYDILALALRRATPKVENPLDVEVDAQEIGASVTIILEFAGFKKAASAGADGGAENPPAPAAETLQSSSTNYSAA